MNNDHPLLGLDLLYGALFTSSRNLSSIEYYCMVIVCFVVAILGFVQGLATGVLLACVTFVVSSSREVNIRSVFSENYARSNTEWSIAQRFVMFAIVIIFVVVLLLVAYILYLL